MSAQTTSQQNCALGMPGFLLAACCHCRGRCCRFAALSFCSLGRASFWWLHSIVADRFSRRLISSRIQSLDIAESLFVYLTCRPGVLLHSMLTWRTDEWLRGQGYLRRCPRLGRDICISTSIVGRWRQDVHGSQSVIQQVCRALQSSHPGVVVLRVRRQPLQQITNPRDGQQYLDAPPITPRSLKAFPLDDNSSA